MHVFKFRFKCTTLHAHRVQILAPNMADMEMDMVADMVADLVADVLCEFIPMKKVIQETGHKWQFTGMPFVLETLGSIGHCNDYISTHIAVYFWY